MDAYELIKQIGGEIVNNRGRAVVDGKRVVVAEMVNDSFTLTDEGKALAATLKPAPKPAAKPKTATKKSAPKSSE